MYVFHLFILALVQGVTEFLPVSSSGHLVLVHSLSNESLGANWQNDLMLDVAVHVGTLFSVLLYFRKDVAAMVTGLVKVLRGKERDQDSRLFIHVILGSPPVILAGFILMQAEPAWIRSLETMAWATIIFGFVLWWVDHVKPEDKKTEDMTWRHALLIGASQALALIPGTSRSGITMTSARWFGYSRTEAARFSLLLSVIAISGAGTLGSLNLLENNALDIGADVLIAASLAFVSGWLAIAVMMRWLAKASFAIFAGYRIILGAVLLVLIYAGVLV